MSTTTTTVRERPILFSSPMVLALLAGKKTVTRRICRAQPEPWKAHHAEGGCHRADWRPAPCDDGTWDLVSSHAASSVPGFGASPYGRPGDRLWVRESWNVRGLAWGMKPRDAAKIAARDAWRYMATDDGLWVHGWKPSIHMPRAASRITLEVTDVRVERLHDITAEDARAEGVTLGVPMPSRVNGEPGVVAIYDPIKAFAVLWDGINGARCAWASNPWLWVVGFRVLPRDGAPT